MSPSLGLVMRRERAARMGEWIETQKIGWRALVWTRREQRLRPRLVLTSSRACY